MTHETSTDAAGAFGPAHTRVEGVSKVIGHARYETDTYLPGMAHAALVRAPTCGHLAGLDLDTARAVPGVIEILTHDVLADAVRPVKHAMAGGYANSTWRPLASSEIAYPGQIVALVVADTREAASEAAGRVGVRLVPEPATYRLEDAADTRLEAAKPGHKDGSVGDIAAGQAKAAARISATYATPVQHHNPMELFATTCAWESGYLTVHEPSRFVCGLQHGLAEQLGISAERVRVISRLVGGHFGSRLDLSQHTALVALAAWRQGRPVQLVPTRSDGFTIATHRPESRHDIELAADVDGRLTALSHRAVVATSRFDTFAMQGTDVTGGLYACPNVVTEERIGRVDRNTPGPMRAPPEVPYLFALESAMDELAVALRIDPVELRRRNDTSVDPVADKRYTSRPLMRCFDEAARRFGWDDTARAAPATRRVGDWLVGAGCSASVRPVKIAPAAVRVSLTADGGALVETAHHEIGTGITTLLAARAGEQLALPMERVLVRLGDTILPPAGISGGSSTTTSLINALDDACGKLRAQMADRSRNDPTPPSVTVEHLPKGFGPEAIGKLQTGHTQLSQGGDTLSCAFGAQFAEVRVHSRTREIRVSRLVGAFAGGRILNPLTAHSQLIGGMIWGIGSALLEDTEIDPATGGYVNNNLADYLVATAADVPSVDAIFVEDEDREVNAAGVKGIGEIAIIGVNAAIANAVYAATGRRVRRLPIRIDDLI